MTSSDMTDDAIWKGEDDFYWALIFASYVAIYITVIYTIATSYICKMGRRDLPDMYTWARGRAAPKGECGHIRQILTAHVTLCYVILPALQTSAELAIHCTAPLYNDGCCLWLWVFNSNISMMFSKIHSVMQYFWLWDLMA